MTAGKRRHDVRETFDLGLGFVGAFLLAFLVITFVLDLHDAARAVPYSITTVVLAAVEVALLLARRHVLQRIDESGS